MRSSLPTWRFSTEPTSQLSHPDPFIPSTFRPNITPIAGKDRFGVSSSAWPLQYLVCLVEQSHNQSWTCLCKKRHQLLAAIACLSQLRAASHELGDVFVQSVWLSRQRLVRQSSHENCPHSTLVPTRRQWFLNPLRAPVAPPGLPCCAQDRRSLLQPAFH